MLIFLLALWKNLRRIIDNFNNTDDIEPAFLILNISIMCEFFGILFEILHLWIYLYNGRGFFIFDFFYSSLNAISSLLITIMFILMATGWTLKYKEFPDAELAVPIIMIAVLFNLIMIGIGNVTNDSYYKFSEYEGISGNLLIFLRLALYG